MDEFFHDLALAAAAAYQVGVFISVYKSYAGSKRKEETVARKR